MWPGQVSSVAARAVNLSSTGILVDAATPEPCPVGSPIVCDVALPRGPLRLRGRVAHHRMLSPAKVGMGIAFTDLPPHTIAELRDVVEGSDEKAQLVRLRFAGKNQLVCTRALPTAEGFQFTTALPFLRTDTEVEISLSPDANLTTKGWVSSVALGAPQEDGIPRLVIDIRAGESAAPRLAPNAAVSGEVESAVASPDLGAVPERVWQPGDFNPANDAGHQATNDATNAAAHDAAIAASNEVSTELDEADLLEDADADGTPVRRDPDKTEIVRFSDLERPRRARAARARTIALTASAVAVAAVAVVAVRIRPPWAVAARAASAPVVVMMPAAPPAAPVGSAAPVAPASPPSADPPAAVAPTVAPIVKPIAAEPSEAAAEPSAAAEVDAKDAPAETTDDFVVGLVGSLKGAHKYALHTPDGVAFNLPNAHATMKVGTYRPAVKGLRAVWVRDLPGGGTHLRFFFAKSRPAPEVRLHTDGVRVAAR
jgi:hypothetical protein